MKENVGLCGAQRVGKSTLAREYATQAGIKFFETSAARVFAKRGFDPKVDYSIDVRLLIQQEILDEYANDICAYTLTDDVVFITDRTPIDMMAYLLADVQRKPYTDAIENKVEIYVKNCYEVTNECIPTLVFIQPGIKPVEAEGKAPSSYAYTEHISMLISGLINDTRFRGDCIYMPREVTSLSDRVDRINYIQNVLPAVFEKALLGIGNS